MIMMDHHTNSPFATPFATGTLVLALKFKDGIVMAADSQASYDSMAGFMDTRRLRQYGDATVAGFGGDVSDMLYVDRTLKVNDPRVDKSYGGVQSLNAADLHNYMGKMLYPRSNQFCPLLNQVLVAGFDSNKKPFLAAADLRGPTFSAPSLVTGYGYEVVQPIMRLYAETEEQAAALSQEQAIEIVRECMTVLYYRDLRILDKYSLAVITKKGVTMSTTEEVVKQSREFADWIRGYGTQTE